MLSFDFDFVKANGWIAYYASVFINGNFFIIGGEQARWKFSVRSTSIIARLNAATWSWSRAGQLNIARYHHGAIWVKSKLVVVGGGAILEEENYPIEFCSWENEEFSCTDKSTLTNRNNYPLLFAVSEDYKNC